MRFERRGWSGCSCRAATDTWGATAAGRGGRAEDGVLRSRSGARGPGPGRGCRRVRRPGPRLPALGLARGRSLRVPRVLAPRVLPVPALRVSRIPALRVSRILALRARGSALACTRGRGRGVRRRGRRGGWRRRRRRGQLRQLPALHRPPRARAGRARDGSRIDGLGSLEGESGHGQGRRAVSSGGPAS